MFIQVKNLTKKFKNSLAVNKINFEIERNKTVGLLGPNGCGKTTSIGMMLGLTLWARSLRGEGKKGASLATVASIVIPVAAASFMLSMDFNFAAADAWDKGDTGNALIVGAVAEYAPSDLLGMVMMLSVSFIGLAAVLQSTDKISRSLGAILAVFSLAMFLLSFTSIDGGPIWMLWMLTIVAAGVNLIRQKA